MKNLLIFTAFCLINLSGCTNDPGGDSFAWLIDSMETEGYRQYPDVKLPLGIRDTLIEGYSEANPKTGYYYSNQLKPKSLKISSIRFEKLNDDGYNTKIFYRFDFLDKEEEKKFADFQESCDRYQTHSKNTADFFYRDSVWYLRFIPMP